MLVKDAPSPSTTRSATARVLQPLVTDLIALALSAKHLHWNVVGRRFLSLHQHLDVLTDDVRNWTDALAERMRALGAAAEGQASTVAHATAIGSVAGGALGDAQVIDHINTQLEGVGERVRDAAAALEDDLASQDLVIETQQGLEKHLWMFRALAE